MAVGVFTEVMFRERPHSVRVQLLVEEDDALVENPLATYTHRLIAKLSYLDDDDDAIFDLTGPTYFTDEDENDKIVEALIPASATDSDALPEGRTTRLYLQWQTTDGDGEPWIIADGSLTVRSSLPQTA